MLAIRGAQIFPDLLTYLRSRLKCHIYSGTHSSFGITMSLLNSGIESYTLILLSWEYVSWEGEAEAVGGGGGGCGWRLEGTLLGASGALLRHLQTGRQ